MTGSCMPWDDIHHISYLLPKLKRIEVGEFITTMTGDAPFSINPLSMHGIYVEGNMESIDKMIPIEISKNLGVMENVFVGADYSLEEIQIYTELFK